MITRLNETVARLRTAARDTAAIREGLLQLHKILPVTPQEVSAADLDSEQDVVTELRAVVACVDHDFLKPAVQHLLGVVEYATSKISSKGGRLPAGLDLRSGNEATRQALFDLVVMDNFTPQVLWDPDDHWVPPYTPEQADLQVYSEHGRWFATWLKLDEPETLPESQRRELLVLEEAPDEPGRLIYREV